MILCLFLLVIPARLSAAEPLEIVVKGVEGDILANVQAALAVPPGLVENGRVNRLWLDRFEHQIPEKVRTAAEPFGYYDTKVSIRRETIGEGSYRLVVDVVPGEPVYVAGVDVSIRGPGAGEEPLKSLVASFPLRKGDVLREDIYEKAKGELKSRALGLGYLEATFSAHEIAVSRESHTAEIRLTLDTGPRYRFGRVYFEGAPQYPEKFLSRFLTFRKGEVFSYGKLGETQLNLLNSERFRDVIISPEREKARGLEVPVSVRLKPAPRRHLRIGAGYGTDTGPRFSLDYRDLNLFHRGRELKADLNISSRIQALGTAYIVPGKGSIDSFNEVKFALKREDVPTYKTKLVSLEADRTRSLGGGRIGSAYVRIQKEDSTVGDQRSRARLIMPGFRLSARRYDNLIRPTRGYRYSIDVKAAHRALGSSISFVRLAADGDAVIPLPWRLSILSRFKAGFTFQGDAFEQMPASLRFFAGGDRSVRGYSYQSLGPKDSSGQVIGGKNILVGSVELDRAIFTDWGVAAFFDAGNAFDRLTDFTLYKGAGIGVRYYTKIGGIRLDLARQVGVSHPGYRVHLTVGFEQ
ncbi:MAG: autotransporter assembly complex protein TamA [Candidatus Sulfobium sp.]